MGVVIYRRRRVLLAIGLVAPILAFVSVGLAALLYPGFNNATQYISDLGGPKAQHPELFNGAILITGLGAFAAGAGFALAVVALGGSWTAAGLTALSFGLAGVGMTLASYYHWPDPRHLAINLALGIQIAPLTLLWGLARAEGMAGLRRFLIAVFVVMAILTVLTKHLLWPGLVNDANVGWWERAFAIVLVGWIAVAALALERRLVFLASRIGSAEGPVTD